MQRTLFVDSSSPRVLTSLIEESGGYFCFVFLQKLYFEFFYFTFLLHMFLSRFYICIDKINCILGSKLHHYMHVI